jgi:hypothetical protein
MKTQKRYLLIFFVGSCIALLTLFCNILPQFGLEASCPDDVVVYTKCLSESYWVTCGSNTTISDCHSSLGIHSNLTETTHATGTNHETGSGTKTESYQATKYCYDTYLCEWWEDQPGHFICVPQSGRTPQNTTGTFYEEKSCDPES